jgi:uncharacterized RDD family membrane protein YckC
VTSQPSPVRDDEDSGPIGPGPGIRWSGDGSLAPKRAPRWGADPATGPAEAEPPAEVIPAGHARREPTVDGRVLAPVYRRAGGWFIDYVMKSVLIFLVLIFVSLEGITDPLIPIIALPSQLLYHGYDFLFMANGWTPGMRWMRLRIVRVDNGQPPGYARSFRRATFVAGVYLFLYATALIVRDAGNEVTGWHALIAFAAQSLFFGSHAVAFWDRRRQTLQDKIAGTVVVIQPREDDRPA